MRAIKFRIWDAVNKKWIDGPREFCLSLNEGKWYENTWIFQQFTGLLDKNGKEIYEGDIVEYESHDPQFSKTLVRWTRDDEDNHPGFVIHDSYSQYGKPTIIGTIFENPELLQ